MGRSDRISDKSGSIRNSQVPHSALYKMVPSFSPPTRELDVCHSNVIQPFRPCANCFLPDTAIRKASYVNMLDFPMFNGLPYPLGPGVYPPSRWFADIRYTWATPISHTYPSVTRAVLRSARVQNTVNEASRSENLSISQIEKRAVSFLNEMKAKLSKFVLKIFAYLLFKVFRRQMSHLLVCPEQMELLKNAEKTGIPIVYLPSHRSHLDYLLVSWTVWHWGLRVPHIASGDNLNLTGLGLILRCGGAFFIRRRFSYKDNGGNDALYRSVLQSYITEILRCGLPVEFFLEGTRSRSGKSLTPKIGLISNIFDAVEQGLLPDVYLVPVSFTYDQVAEGIFFNELMGMKKQRESVWLVCKGLVQVLGSSRCGDVRIHFGAPVLLKEYAKSLKAVLDDLQEQLPLCHRVYSYRELLPWHNSKTPESALIRAIGYHITYDAQMQTSLSIAMVTSALLLCKYRDGVSEKELAADLSWLCDLLTSMGFDVVGWVGKQTDGQIALKKAFLTIGESLLISDGEIALSGAHIDILRLAYHKNALVPALSIPSAVSLALLSQRNCGRSSKKSTIETALMICDVLQYEVIFFKPCENLKAKLGKELKRLASHHLLLTQREADQGDSAESTFYAIADEESDKILKFYSNILRPFLQSLFLVLHHLLSLDTLSAGKDVDFIRFLLSRPYNLMDSPFKLFLEALNSDSLNNCLKLLREKGVISEEPNTTVINAEEAKDLHLSLRSLLCTAE